MPKKLIRFMKKEDAIAYILQSMLEDGLKFDMKDVYDRIDMAKWIYEKFRL